MSDKIEMTITMLDTENSAPVPCGVDGCTAPSKVLVQCVATVNGERREDPLRPVCGGHGYLIVSGSAFVALELDEL